MTIALAVLAALTLLLWLPYAWEVLFRAQRWLVDLTGEGPEAPADPPLVSIVVPARDEARGIEAAMRSLLALDYPRFEVIAVDDRSSDGTGAILDRLAAASPRLEVLHVEELPAGWLGKNHALATGAERARGELLLFTDADVVFDRWILARAVAELEHRGLDHLTAPADVVTRGPLLKMFTAAFAVVFNGYFRPWRAADPLSERFAGFGAFNLLRVGAYRAAGGHEELALDPLDDVGLGRILKASGARQAMAVAGRALRVEWYPSYRAAVRGLEKNTLAAVGFSPALLVAGSAAQFVFISWPYLGVILAPGPARWLNLATVALIASTYLSTRRRFSLPPWAALTMPVGLLLIHLAYAHALWRTLRQGGIVWRGRFHPLEELRSPGGRGSGGGSERPGRARPRD